MKVLVDFDNIPVHARSKGIVYIADRIVRAIAPAVSYQLKIMEMRLYGGWDRDGGLSIEAQRLTGELASSLPRIFTFPEQTPPVSITVHARLARALEIVPGKVLANTVREVMFQKKLKCSSPDSAGCKNPRCPLSHTATFLTSGMCPDEQCSITPGMLLKAVEQKLVDTMMVADLIHLSHKGEKAIGIVSSDDDMWPGIISAMIQGAHVLHIQTIGAKERLPYRDGIQGSYTQIGL